MRPAKIVPAVVVASCCISFIAAAEQEYASHPPQRPGPALSGAPLGKGPAKFVDVNQGNDENSGAKDKPWKSLGHAFRQLTPGDTLYVRGGTYYEHTFLTKSGTAEAPITIRAYPGETVIIDGGLREFYDDPAGSWTPFKEGAPGEYVSTKTYQQFNDRQVPDQFLPGSWEPLWGIEDDRPLALGNFADSMVPLHGYRLAIDLRSDSEYWLESKKDDTKGVYCGPGLWFNRETGRVHCRLAHNKLPGLGDRAYRGETDPRKLKLIVALGYGDDVLRINGIRHVKLQDLVLRGATGSPMFHIYGSQHVELDHVTVYGGFPCVLVNASQEIKVTNSAFRGLAAPWTGRAHQKYRGTATYQIVFRNNQPVNENIEFANCEFTDDHDFAFVRFVKNLQFHHNFVDNFNDDGFECGPKLRDHSMYIYQNRIGACLGTFTQHEFGKDDSPLDHDPQAGAYIYRNVVDQRAGVPYHLPKEAQPDGEFLRHEGHLVGDHGGPIWAVMHVYHNTFLRRTPTFRDYFLFGLGAQGLRHSERDVFNNIFAQAGAVPGAGFAGQKEAGNLREGGNVLWGMTAGPELKADPFAKFRASPLFTDSMRFHSPGWTTQDRVGDPKFVGSLTDDAHPVDVRIQKGSAAAKAGVPLPADFPDPLRDEKADRPDAGALPVGAKPWKVGIDARLGLFSGKIEK